MEDLVTYFNGEYLLRSKIFLGIDNVGFTRGYAAYECFRTYGHLPFRLNDHITRLKRTCNQLLIEFPKEDLHKITKNLITSNPGSDLVFRIYVTDNIEDNTYHLVVLCNTPKFFSLSHPSGRPLLLKTVVDRRDNVGIKSTSYTTSITEIKKAKKLGFDDILYTDVKGNIHELSKANFFAIKGNTIFTPQKNLLPGITRLTIIDIAKEYGFNIIEKEITLSFLEEVEEVFASSTIRAITQIGKIDHLEFNCHEKTNHLKSYFTNLASLADNHDKRHLSSSHS